MTQTFEHRLAKFSRALHSGILNLAHHHTLKKQAKNFNWLEDRHKKSAKMEEAARKLVELAKNNAEKAQVYFVNKQAPYLDAQTEIAKMMESVR